MISYDDDSGVRYILIERKKNNIMYQRKVEKANHISEKEVKRVLSNLNLYIFYFVKHFMFTHHQKYTVYNDEISV